VTTNRRATPAPPAARTNPQAIAALACGIIQLAVLPAGLVAIFLGHRALRQIRRTGEDGYGMAKAGLILGYIGLAVLILGIFLALALIYLLSRPLT
jgi:hypothetical protein